MKKILLLLAFLSFTFMNAQLNEDFESGTFPPTGWASFVGANGLGTTENWKAQAFDGNSVVCVWEIIPGGSTVRSEDWLVSPQFTVDALSTNLQFDNVDSSATEYGSIYTVRVSTASQTTHADFTIVDTQTENEVFHSQTTLTGNTHIVDLSAYVGQAIYVAFVMEQNDGDLWRLDNISMAAPISCGAVTDIVSANETTTSIDLSWTAGAQGTVVNYNVEYGAMGFAQGTGTMLTTNTVTQVLSGLTEGTGYDVYIQADCGTTDGTSEWTKSSVFTTSTPYNVDAGHNNPSNGIENGANCNADITPARTVAHDIIVPANTTLTLTKIVPHVLMAPGVSATTVNVTIYNNALLGSPGAVLNNQPAVVPTSSKQTGTNFGFIVNELELDLTPVDLVNTTGADLSFWIGISVSKSDGADSTNAFWENTTVSLIGSGQAFDDGTAGFVVDAAVDGVYSFVANTSTASTEDDTLASSVTIYPTTVNDVITIKNNSVIALTNASIYDVNGRKVLQENLNNLIGSKTINVENLATGLYFVEINSADGKLVKKFIKK